VTPREFAIERHGEQKYGELADRIANVEACWAARDRRLFMYRQEYHEFRAALFPGSTVGPTAENMSQMWAELDDLLGWRQP
jgi:hypothetical protein